MPLFVSPNDMAYELGVHPETIRKWIRDGRIKATKYGGVWRIPKEELQRVITTGLDPDSEGGVMVAASQP